MQRVFDRIASASTDDQLQNELLKYLSPVIHKLSSGDAQVRSTVSVLIIDFYFYTVMSTLCVILESTSSIIMTSPWNGKALCSHAHPQVFRFE